MGRNLHKCRKPYITMENYPLLPRIEAGPDQWREDKYCLALSVRPDMGIDQIDHLLRGLGYDLHDLDQYGRTYRHRWRRHNLVELEEGDGDAYPLGLIIDVPDRRARRKVENIIFFRETPRR